MTVLGYELGSVPIVRQNFDKVILLIIFVSFLPSILEVLRARRTSASLAPKSQKAAS